MKVFGAFLLMVMMTSGIALAQGDPRCNGENCEEAYPINNFPYTDSRNSCFYEDDFGEASPDVFYRLEIEYTSDILITLCNGTAYDSYLWLLADDCQTEIASNDDACSVVSEMDLDCLAAGVYYIVVEGYWEYCGCYTLDVIMGDGCEVPTNIEPTGYALQSNYPNPFNPVTTIDFSLAEPQQTVLTVFDVTGKTVTRLIDGDLSAGDHSVVFDATQVNSGVYFYRLDAGDFSATRKMTVIK
jgi:hypothetical protein